MLLSDAELDHYGTEFVSGGFRYIGITFDGYLATRTARSAQQLLRELNQERVRNPPPMTRFALQRFSATLERLRTFSVRDILTGKQ